MHYMLKGTWLSVGGFILCCFNIANVFQSDLLAKLCVMVGADMSHGTETVAFLCEYLLSVTLFYFRRQPQSKLYSVDNWLMISAALGGKLKLNYQKVFLNYQIQTGASQKMRTSWKSYFFFHNFHINIPFHILDSLHKKFNISRLFFV